MSPQHRKDQASENIGEITGTGTGKNHEVFVKIHLISEGIPVEQSGILSIASLNRTFVWLNHVYCTAPIFLGTTVFDSWQNRFRIGACVMVDAMPLSPASFCQIFRRRLVAFETEPYKRSSCGLRRAYAI